jgi:hypothetical protein
MAGPTAIEVAAQAGIDLGLVDDNLRLTYEQRVQQHQDAPDFALEVERAGPRMREKLRAVYEMFQRG